MGVLNDGRFQRGFLDFSSCEFEPVIQWADKYHVPGKRQGALLRKDEYVRAFKRANLCDGSYRHVVK